jgi:hypothetical protein
MPSQQPLDTVPLWLFVLLFIGLTFACYEIGYRVGNRSKSRGEAEEGAAGTLVGSILALMAFLLAVTMGMAGDRFDTRRGLVLQEATTLGTTYLRAGYLPEPASTELQALLAEYVPLRIATSDPQQLQANIQRSEELHVEMWAIAEGVAREAGNDVNALFIESLNETIDLHEMRITAGLYGRVPPTILWLLIIGSALSLGLVGYSAGLAGRRSPVLAGVLIFAMGTVLALVMDLDRPADGLITTNQRPLIDLQESIEESS